MSTTSHQSPDALTPPDPISDHYHFYQHLLAGGIVERNDSLNGAREVLAASTMAGGPASISRYGYRDLRRILRFETLYHKGFNEEVRINHSSEMGWHYERREFAGHGKDFEHLSPVPAPTAALMKIPESAPQAAVPAVGKLPWLVETEYLSAQRMVKTGQGIIRDADNQYLAKAKIDIAEQIVAGVNLAAKMASTLRVAVTQTETRITELPFDQQAAARQAESWLFDAKTLIAAHALSGPTSLGNATPPTGKRKTMKA